MHIHPFTHTIHTPIHTYHSYTHSHIPFMHPFTHTMHAPIHTYHACTHNTELQLHNQSKHYKCCCYGNSWATNGSILAPHFTFSSYYHTTYTLCSLHLLLELCSELCDLSGGLLPETAELLLQPVLPLHCSSLGLHQGWGVGWWHAFNYVIVHNRTPAAQD